MTFTALGGQTAAIELRPAQAAYGESFTLTGLGLAGDTVGLSLHSGAWPRAELVDPVAWGVAAMADRVVARVRSTAGTRELLPGSYDAAVHVTRVRATPAGPRPITQKSNVVPIVVTPRIAAATVNPPDGVTITGEVFQHPDLVAGAVEVYVDAVRLAPDDDGVLAPGEFVASAAQIDLRVGPDVPRGVPVLLRVLVNGAEAAPRWVTFP